MGRTEFSRMPFPVKEDVLPNPVDIRLLGPAAVVPRPNGVAHLIE